MPIGFGIIGCGMISRFHARAINEARGARLVACCSSNPASAVKLAGEFGITAHDTLDAMLTDARVEAVTMATPSGAHLAPAVAAAKAGRHVIVEKPLEITTKRCDKIIAACEQAGVRLATIFPSRFHDSAVEMKKAVDKGRFGRLTLGDAYVKWFRTQEYYDSKPWRGSWELDGGGALMNQAIHSVDLLQWLMGPVEQVQAQSATLGHERIEVEDTVVATLRFASGALGVIEATTAAYPGYLKRVELHGTHGSAVLEEEDIKAWDFAKAMTSDERVRAGMQGSKSTGGGAADPAAIGHHGHALQLHDFVQAIQKDRTPAIDGHEGRKSVAIIEAVYKSAKSGKMVRLA